MVIADSAKVLFSGNGHYYQKFDSVPQLWHDAQSECTKLGAHLVTISSKAENDFLASPPIDAGHSGPYNWFGGHQLSGVWTWVTGEPFAFKYFASGQSNNEFLEGLDNSTSKTWSSIADSALPYICEWEPKTYISVLGLSDLNGNSFPESAALYIDTKTFAHTVVVKDTDTQATLKTIVFDTNNITPPIAMAQVSDMNANGAPEIAVMYWTKRSGAIGMMIGLMIKDASTGIASRSAPITVLSSQYKAISLTSTDDITGDGISELEVLVQKYNDNTSSSLIVDPVAGTIVKTIKF